MNASTEEQNRGSVILKVIIGIAAVTGVIWLVMQCPTCH